MKEAVDFEYLIRVYSPCGAESCNPLGILLANEAISEDQHRPG